MRNSQNVVKKRSDFIKDQNVVKKRSDFTKDQNVVRKRCDFIKSQNITGTRQDDDLATSEFKTNIAKKTFRYRGANFWNSINKTGIQSIKETSIFGKLIKQNIISNY